MVILRFRLHDTVYIISVRPHFVIRYWHVQYAVQHADTSYLYSFWEHKILRVRVHKWNDYCTYYGIAATVRLLLRSYRTVELKFKGTRMIAR